MTFDETYREYRPLIRSLSRQRSRQTRIPSEDFESAMTEALWRAHQAFDPERGDPFEALARRSMNNAAINVITRKHGNYSRRVYATLDAPETEDSPKSEVADEVTVESTFFTRNKRADQRQLIDSLCDPRQVDYDTTRIVSMFPQYESITALAKALGLHHETVSRKLKRLSRRYDANRFGDLREYLAV